MAKKKKKTSTASIDESSQDVPMNKSFEDDMPLAKIAKSKSDDVKLSNSQDDDLPLAKIIVGPQIKKLKSDIENPQAMSKSANSLQILKTIVSSQSVDSLPLSASVISKQVSSLLPDVNKSVTSPELVVKTVMKVEYPLPEGLSGYLLKDISLLKSFTPPESGTKGKYFTAEVNKVLLRWLLIPSDRFSC